MVASQIRGNTIDHLWLLVRALNVSTRFYSTVAPTVGAELLTRRPDRTTVRRGGPPSFRLVRGEPTQTLHLAFGAPDAATVEAFHRAGLDAGYASLGEPGERPEHHDGYYGAYLADPDSRLQRLNNADPKCVRSPVLQTREPFRDIVRTMRPVRIDG